MKHLLISWMLFFICFHPEAQDLGAFDHGTITNKGTTLPFRFLRPSGDSSKKYPLIVFLHGAFEKGDDNERQLAVGGKFFLRDSIRTRYPAYILFPQCPLNDSWVYFENRIDFSTGRATDWNFPFNKKPTPVTAVLKKLIDSLVIQEHIDVSRVYIAGYSQGGMGVLDLVARYPDLFAAGLAICGAGEPSTTKYFAHKTALWLFHGKNDDIVPVDFARDYAKRLRRLGSVVQYSEYAGKGHDCWPMVFAEPDLMNWLFLQYKK